MKTVFVVIDTETTKRNGLVFDFGWTSFDRYGKTYSQGWYAISGRASRRDHYDPTIMHAY